MLQFDFVNLCFNQHLQQFIIYRSLGIHIYMDLQAYNMYMHPLIVHTIALKLYTLC